MRAFYLKHATPDSCNYCAFTRKMNKLKKQMGDKSGMKQINPTFTLVNLQMTHLYLPLMGRRTIKK